MNDTEDPDHLREYAQEEFSQETEITSQFGLHARPAALIAATASKYESSIDIIHDNHQANAKSIAEILGLGLTCGNRITITARGKDAAAAAAEIAAEIKGMGTKFVPAAEEKLQKSGNEKKGHSGPGQNSAIKGVPVCPLPAAGKAVFFKRKEFHYEENSSLSAEEEKNRLEKAIEKAKHGFAEKKEKAGNEIERGVFEAYSSIVNDPYLLSRTMQAIKNGKTAQAAFKEAITDSENLIKSSPNPAIHSRIADYEAVLKATISALCSRTDSKPSCADKKQVFPPESIIITDFLIPGEINLPDKNIKGIISAYGSSNSHAALMLKGMNIPSIAAAGEAALKIKENSVLSVNFKEGEIIVYPEGSPLPEIKIKSAGNDENRLKPAVMRDGIRIAVAGNASSRKEAMYANSAGAEGIGLLRTELLFAEDADCPGEDEQAGLYSEIASAQKNFSVNIRLFDAGNDKPLKFMQIPGGENPALGMRGIRAFALNEKKFRSQIRAVLRVNPEGKAKILIPVVSLPEEFKKIKEIIRQEAETLGVLKTETGIMIETPAAALMAEKFAKYADFMSIGSNDLAQFTLAYDRTSSSAPMPDPLSPAVLKLIKIAVSGAAAAKCGISLCGDLASDKEALPLLIGLGLRSFSVPLPYIPEIKQAIRRMSAEDCEKLASAALEMENSAEIRKLAADYIKGAAEKAEEKAGKKTGRSFFGRIFEKVSELLKQLMSCFRKNSRQNKFHQ